MATAGDPIGGFTGGYPIRGRDNALWHKATPGTTDTIRVELTEQDLIPLLQKFIDTHPNAIHQVRKV